MNNASTSHRTITAFFDNRAEAARAVEQLAAAGIPRSDVSLVAGAEGGATAQRADDDMGFWETLKDLFMPDEDRYSYAEGLRRGGYLVTVRTTEAHAARAVDLLEEHGSIDMDQREAAWRSEGWMGYRPEAVTGASAPRTAATSTGAAATGALGSSGSALGATAGRTTGTAAAATGREEVIPVAEERLRVGKREVNHGRVRIRSYVVETPVQEQVNLREEHVHVERRAVDRPLAGDEKLFQDRTIEVEERAEEAVVAKDARIREELVVKKDVGQRAETISDTVRHTEVKVEDDRTGRGLERDDLAARQRAAAGRR